MQPGGLQFGDVFRYITMPPEVQSSTSIVTDPTASLPASMPLLFMLGVWGNDLRISAATGRKAVRPAPLARCGGSKCRGGPDFRTDWRSLSGRFPPLFDLGRCRGFRRSVAPPGIRGGEGLGRRYLASSPSSVSSASQPTSGLLCRPLRPGHRFRHADYVEFQNSISDVTGHPLRAIVIQAHRRPVAWAPRGQLYIVGNCSALYISNGLGASGKPTYGLNWLLVEKAPNSKLCQALSG